MMNYNIRGENIEVTPAIRDYVEKKVNKLDRYFVETPNTSVNVKLKVNPDKTSKVEITIPMPHLVLRAEESNEDMYAAIDLITDKLERQIRKHKTKVNRKLREKGSTRELFTPDAGLKDNQAEKEEDTELQIVRTKHFNLKPMDSEEAVLQMNLLGHNFFIYTDAETNNTNIVYRRKDGKYGLIETV
ncbi:ribosomal subunit interface protein [Weizmannia acidilactici]|uniref:Ribosome hibernation promoting factor n=1 Tax=Weizmannia acidilactici TaxID=2607726 RepID=A0A5J4JEE3_9BACI|nr:ribosome-associated translation inhibitor RaiA [Weizmannia acidilactici]GER65996.1 ribosomal subunit interface protein [Weizmannia acidilactici]GER68790.1 ribosomal subunit interface protein [Weizmannia acidilactici]GER72925.1 ribosomal subunit interface protein [Weizmannia acidilactici]